MTAQLIILVTQTQLYQNSKLRHKRNFHQIIFDFIGGSDTYEGRSTDMNMNVELTDLYGTNYFDYLLNQASSKCVWQKIGLYTFLNALGLDSND